MSKGLAERQIADFDRDGYLVVEGVLSESDLCAIEAEYADIVDRVTAGLVAVGALSPLKGTTFNDKYVEALEQLDDMYRLYQHLDISLPLFNELPPDASMNAGPAVFNLLKNERVLDIVESVIGPEIYSNPVQHTRIKPPRKHLPHIATDANVAATAWHQDSAVVDDTADQTDMLTVWLAITDATTENGCLVAVAGSHRSDETLHCPGKIFPAEIYIPESIINTPRIVPLEVKAGGMVLLHKMTEHGSYENDSDGIRWSFDLRYQPIGKSTGREIFPGFVARSPASPESVLDDADEWANLWWEARDRIANREVDVAIGSRWDQYSDHPVCA